MTSRDKSYLSLLKIPQYVPMKEPQLLPLIRKGMTVRAPLAWLLKPYYSGAIMPEYGILNPVTDDIVDQMGMRDDAIFFKWYLGLDSNECFDWYVTEKGIPRLPSVDIDIAFNSQEFELASFCLFAVAEALKQKKLNSGIRDSELRKKSGELEIKYNFKMLETTRNLMEESASAESPRKYTGFLDPILTPIYESTRPNNKDVESFFRGIFKRLSPFEEFVKIFDDLNKIKQGFRAILYDKVGRYEETQMKVLSIIDVCNCRAYEGVYINDALKGVRESFASIISEKLKSSTALYPSPTFLDDCSKLQQNNLISTTSPLNMPMSSMGNAKDIFKHIRDKFARDGLKDPDHRLIGCQLVLFTVLNQSRTANDPPPIPYVDIDDLRMLHAQLNRTDQIQLLSSALGHKDSISDVSQAGISPDALFHYFDLEPLISPPGPITQRIISQLEYFQDSLGGSTVSYFKELLEDLQVLFGNQPQTLAKVDITMVRPPLEDIIRKLDTINAATAIGSLEFTDRVAKLLSTERTCRIREDQPTMNNYTGELRHNFGKFI